MGWGNEMHIKIWKRESGRWNVEAVNTNICFVMDAIRNKSVIYIINYFLSFEVTAVERNDKFLPFGSLHVRKTEHGQINI